MITSTTQGADLQITLATMVYIVVNEESGLVGVFLDEAAAIACAQYRQGVIVHLNIDQDFRP